MTLPYIVRLACLCLQSLFLVNFVMVIVCFGLYRVAKQTALSMRPSNAARLFLMLRLLPFLAAVLVVAGLCIPSYLRYEQNTGTEATGWFCLVTAALGLGLCLTSLSRSIKAGLHMRSIRRRVKNLPTRVSAHASTPIYIADSYTVGTPLLSLIGILKPRLVVSRSLLQTLSAEQFEVALAHEDAHLLSRDNLKRLLLAIVPGILPFASGSPSIERQWQHYAELCADETAARGLPQRSIALAEALVQVARLANNECAVPLTSSLAAGNVGLALRIDRLIRTGTDASSTITHRNAWKRLPFSLACAAMLALLPALSHPLYRLLESLLH